MASSPGGKLRPNALAVLRLHDRQVGRFLTFENPPGVDAGLAIGLRKTLSVAHQATGFGSLTQGVDRRDPVVRRERNQLNATDVEQKRGNNTRRTELAFVQAR